MILCVVCYFVFRPRICALHSERRASFACRLAAGCHALCKWRIANLLRVVRKFTGVFEAVNAAGGAAIFPSERIYCRRRETMGLRGEFIRRHRRRDRRHSQKDRRHGRKDRRLRGKFSSHEEKPFQRGKLRGFDGKCFPGSGKTFPDVPEAFREIGEGVALKGILAAEIGRSVPL